MYVQILITSGCDPFRDTPEYMDASKHLPILSTAADAESRDSIPMCSKLEIL